MSRHDKYGCTNSTSKIQSREISGILDVQAVYISVYSVNIVYCMVGVGVGVGMLSMSGGSIGVGVDLKSTWGGGGGA